MIWPDEPSRVAVLRDRCLDRPTGAEAGAVRQEIGDDLLEAGSIPSAYGRPAHVDGQCAPRARDLAPEPLDDVADQRGHADLLKLQVEAVRADARHAEGLAHQLRQLSRLALRQIDRAGKRLRPAGQPP